jgi:hypothetical protein
MAIRVRGGNSRARSYPPAVVTGPTITSSASVSVAEGTALAHQLKADEVVTWSKVGGADTALFTLSASGGTLTMTAKDYETPADANTDNAYVVNVRATDRNGRVANQTVTVTVTDVDEVPTAFTFTDMTGADAATVYTSNTITVAGLGAAASGAHLHRRRHLQEERRLLRLHARHCRQRRHDHCPRHVLCQCFDRCFCRAHHRRCERHLHRHDGGLRRN